MTRLCVPISPPPTYPTPTPTKPEIKYEYIIAGVVILALLAYILKPKKE